MKILVFIQFYFLLGPARCNSVIRNVCDDKMSNHIYLVLGERGVLSHENISIPTGNKSQLLPPECKMQIVTCSSCIVVLKLRNLVQTKMEKCDEVDSNATCVSEYVRFSEQKKTVDSFIYDNTSVSSNELIYKSETRYLSIDFVNWKMGQAFSIDYTAERNRHLYKGTPSQDNITHGGYIKSAHFPSYYPRDIGAEYLISCDQTDKLCRIRIIFIDFLVPTESSFQFYDWTGRKIRLRSGILSRPPVVVSSGPSLLIRFYANGATGLGFKAAYYFITGEPPENELRPITDCGGEVENVGGGITMMNMVDADEVKRYDCIWLIRPYNAYLASKLNIFASVVTFKNLGSAELKIIEGQTSEGKVLESVKEIGSPSRQHVVSGIHGCYISLIATFNSSSTIAISYAVFSHKVCFSGPEFLCLNKRCLSRKLYCDGFNQCGDNSDEPSICSKEWRSEPESRAWYSHIPNYYFPKTDRYIDLKTASLIFMLSSFGLVFMIGALALLLYRTGIRARHQRELQSRLHTISDLFGGGEADDEPVADDPPIYEAPPSYEEVMKKEIEKTKRCSCHHKCPKLTVDVAGGSKSWESPPPYLTGSQDAPIAGSSRDDCTRIKDEPGPSQSRESSKLDMRTLWDLLPRMKRNERKNEEDSPGRMAATWSHATAKPIDPYTTPVPIKKNLSIKGSTSVDVLFSVD